MRQIVNGSILFALALSLLAPKLAQCAEVQEIQFANRIEIRAAGDKTKFIACHLSTCKPIGKAEGYPSTELKKKRLAGDERSGLIGQLIQCGMDAKEGGDMVFAMFSKVVEHEGQRYQSAWCDLSTVESILAKGRASSKKSDFVYRTTNFHDNPPGCGAFLEGSEKFKEVVKLLSKALTSP